ncbi:MAG: TIGR03013 family PEP-CTERM/XrtA system glycosyltransferase [Pseudomonadales bacterium]|nr:TIGR03013 family PEP-CTERM/XrtA system glycosyltransferase [Pseudomonadales bacterium]
MSSIRIFKHHIHTPHIVLGAIETAICFFSVYFGSFIRFGETISIEEEDLFPLTIRAVSFSVILVISMTSLGVYQSHLREGLLGMTLRTAASFLFASILLTMVFYLVPGLFFGRGIFAFAMICAFVMIIMVRYLYFNNVDQTLLQRRILVLGAGERANVIAERLRRKIDTKGFEIFGFLHRQGEVDEVKNFPVLINEQPLVEFALENKIDEIVVAVNDRRRGLPIDELLDCKIQGIDVIDIVDFFEREIQRIELDLFQPSSMVFSDGFNRGIVRQGSKRALDLSVSVVMFVLASPILLMAALAIRIEDGRKTPIFYSQERVGLDGKTFNVLKFRSMITDAEKSGAQWAQVNDARITKVGGFLRKYRIDELPQLLNVLKGEMSLVGPRPERPEFVNEFNLKIPYYDKRHQVKPGVTGWAQINYPYGACDEDARQKLQYDLYYAKNHSLFMDLLVIVQTVETVLYDGQ